MLYDATAMLDGNDERMLRAIAKVRRFRITTNR